MQYAIQRFELFVFNVLFASDIKISYDKKKPGLNVEMSWLIQKTLNDSTTLD